MKRSDKNVEQKAKKRSGSFVLRVTLGQSLKMLHVLLTIDVLVFLIYWGVSLYDMDRTAGLAGGMAYEEAQEYVEQLPEPIALERETGEVNVFRLDANQLEERLGLIPGAARGFRFDTDDTGVQIFRWRGRITYTIMQPYGEGETLSARFDLSQQVLRFYHSALVVLAIELMMWISFILSTRRSVRHILAPIRQLAATATSISEQDMRVEAARIEKEARKAAGKQAAPDLKLSGTIDTLNKITAKRLDTRIPVESEREELRGLASAINGMLDRLDIAYSSQLRFVSDASHELRTPIAVLQGYANLLDRWGKDDPAVLQESIEAIKAEAEGMQNLVEQLLFLARSDNNSIVMQVQPADMSDLAEDVLRDTRLIDKNHEFYSNVEPGCWVEGDTGLLKQALRIFVDNAVKYTPTGERIGIGVRRDGEWTKISVTDNGIGIPAEELPHVFERFYRADESRARATGGTGLGLSIAHWIVQRHGGHVEITSRKDIGTRLTMVLPAVEIEEEPPDAGIGVGELILIPGEFVMQQDSNAAN